MSDNLMAKFSSMFDQYQSRQHNLSCTSSSTVPGQSDSALQGPDSAPGPSTATHVPPSLGPSRHDAPSGDEYPYPRGRMDEWEHVRYGSRHVSSPERLRDELERTHTEIVETKDYIDFCRARGRAPPDHSYRDLDILQSRYDQLSLTLSEWHAFSSSRRGSFPILCSSSSTSRFVISQRTSPVTTTWPVLSRSSSSS